MLRKLIDALNKLKAWWGSARMQVVNNLMTISLLRVIYESFRARAQRLKSRRKGIYKVMEKNSHHK